MPVSSGEQAAGAGALALIGVLALIKLAIHLAVAANYGYFRDELYYIDAGHHLSFGYVDFPPFVAVLAFVLDRLTADNLIALHVLPALAGACLVAVTGLMACVLGRGRVAQGLAALGAPATITFLATGSIFSMDAWDQLWWVLAALIVMLRIKQHDPRLWLAVGLVVGLGFLTKLTMLFFAAALVASLLLTPLRRDLRARWRHHRPARLAALRTMAGEHRLADAAVLEPVRQRAYHGDTTGRLSL